MNAEFLKVLQAPAQDRRDLFLGAATRLGTPEANIEKDFWVCWTLDVLFNRLDEGNPRLLFKGGTSLSKAYGLISRFSEDIDITVFRDDLGQQVSVAELEALSGKKRRARLDAIKTTCRDYIGGRLLQQLTRIAQDTMEATGLDNRSLRIEPDDQDPDGQSVLVWYPGVASGNEDYIRRAIKIESGAKSALDPHQSVTVTPYVAADVLGIDLAINNITTVAAERTFWDKIIILHGIRRWFERRGILRYDGQRVSRHYYDLYRMMEFHVALRALADADLAIDCARHAQLFFGSPDLDLKTAYAGTFAIAPTVEMHDALRRDYGRMSGMIFGEVPEFEQVIESTRQLEMRINKSDQSLGPSV
jgi:hypothetical protein